LKLVACSLLFSSLLIAPLAAQSLAARALYEQALAAMGAGDYTTARHALEEFARTNPAIAESHATLAAIDFKLADYAAAIHEAREAHRLKPTLPGMDALLALSQAEAGQYKDAQPGLERAYRGPGTTAETRRQCALELLRLYGSLNQDRKAAELALELREKYPADAEILYNVGKVLGNSTWLTMQQLFHDQGSTLWAQLAEAEAHESQGQSEAAVRSYRNVLTLDPHHANIHYRIGRTLMARWESSHAAEDLTQAADEFRQELALNPTNANAAYELAGLRWKANDLAAAEMYYAQAVEDYPEFEDALVGLGGVELELEKSAQAVEHLKAATKLRPEDEVAWFRLSQAERRAGNPEGQKAALAEFQRLHAVSAAKGNTALRGNRAAEELTPQRIE